MDSISEMRLAGVALKLAQLTRQLANQLAQQYGIYLRVTQALRTWPQQDALYAQGRTAPGSIVTNVKGGYSYHNFGMAVDLVPSLYAPDRIYSPDWDASHPTWKTMVTAGVALGLTAGAQWRTFPDAPHFQLTGPFPEAGPDDEVRGIYTTQGLLALWQKAQLDT